MMQITDVHFEGGNQHQNITELKWLNTDTGVTGTSPIEEMIAYVRQYPGSVFVEGPMRSWLGVVTAQPEYLQTYTDGAWTNDLLTLPQY
ncbi:MAG TPA: DUF3892 domain-containing protein [Candidatus Saccharimonadales bacterium]|nr:DUF3892 domain-containing protein [Candidatus Saccharimonadales bacterium]